ncbi:phospholipid carrier-dependent glycosyltransferase [Pseudomonas sp. S75]|uniref:ArnT family glycosyltransferase n=1 Tax=unclassified Pseudomonas TaxID=196821 RepID=UPI001903EF34|nr:MULTISPECIES: phospholipid carrier-dependent glycosyltransferase [unclassified Pseudomonas]MBJ9973971.1 phospholipid carrier-dependent glycosyltransferase [Pseudomonas sp. S30]MBK0152099.1 phospholipid carrier-dependent glycosyltransferase [Pseudomonas sp. S75]
MTYRISLLLCLVVLLLFVGLGNHQLHNSTEPRVAGIAMAMHLSDNWVTPTLNGEPFLEKPPLSVWLGAAAIRMWGASPLTVRLASAFAGLFCVLLLYALLRRSGRPVAIAWSAAFILATCASFWANSRQVGEDALLTLGVTMALLAYFCASDRARTHQAHLGLWSLFTLGIVIATLSKGVLGLAMPGVVIFAWLTVESVQRRRWVIAHWLRPALFTLLGLIPLSIWLYLLYRQGGARALEDVLWSNSVGRFSGAFVEAGHHEPFYYYAAKLPEAFLPWNLLVYLGLWHFRKTLLAHRHLAFFSLWLLAQFTLLSLASSKRMVYLMSLTPAAAVIAAEYAFVLSARWRERNARSGQVRPWGGRGRVLIMTGAALITVGYLGAALWLVPRADRQLSFLPLTDQIHALERQGRQVALFQPSERLAGASVFYSQSLLETLTSDAQLMAFLKSAATNVALMERASAPLPPLAVIARYTVGNHAYYFVADAASALTQ